MSTETVTHTAAKSDERSASAEGKKRPLSAQVYRYQRSASAASASNNLFTNHIQEWSTALANWKKSPPDMQSRKMTQESAATALRFYEKSKANCEDHLQSLNTFLSQLPDDQESPDYKFRTDLLSHQQTIQTAHKSIEARLIQARSAVQALSSFVQDPLPLARGPSAAEGEKPELNSFVDDDYFKAQDAKRESVETNLSTAEEEKPVLYSFVQED